jgi:hypothetical protein
LGGYTENWLIGSNSSPSKKHGDTRRYDFRVKPYWETPVAGHIARKIDIRSPVLDLVPQIAETAAGQYSSTAQDLARGKRSEIDHLNGFIVRRGEALGVATPANRLLHAIVKSR